MAKKKDSQTKPSSNARTSTTSAKSVKTAKTAVSISFKQTISLVIPCYNEANRVHLLANAVKQFDKSWYAPYEVIVVDDGSTDNTADLVRQQLDGALIKASRMEVLRLEKNQGKGGALKAGVAAASGDFILTLDADMATSPMELKNWLQILPNHTFEPNQILIGSREHHRSKTEGRAERRFLGLLFNTLTQLTTSLNFADTQCGFKLYPAEFAKQLFTDLKSNGWAHDVEILYQAQLNGYAIETMPVHWKHVADEKIAVGRDGMKMVFQTILLSWRMKFDWFVGQPLRSLGKKVAGESPIYRLLFVLLTAFLMIFMPLISSDFGISGDEYAQKVYGELIAKHYETDGTYISEELDYKGQNALTMQPNLWLYGGFFDYVAAKVNQWFPTYDDYDVRHFLNAIAGFLLIFFVGLLGKEISGSWRVGFLSMLLLALSPRILGHSMMNPKDIPFATAYIFALLNSLRIVQQLPRPGIKPMLYTALGIALAIGIRIGGLLLVGFLGLFVIIAFLVRRPLRRQLTNLPLVGGLVGRLTLVVLAGYFGGLLFWPYGQLDWLNNPLTALREMTNFSTGIQMLFEGKHLWSDELPWYYIPKWQLMAAPLAVLLGAIVGLALYAHSRQKSKDLIFFLMLFAGIFPIAYAIIQDSAVYDGMRQFLFVYPIFVILAAFGWSSWIGFSNKIVGIVGILAIAGLSILPLRFMIQNHPYEYVYFNELFGGTKQAATQYETDYWMISAKNLAEWFVENVPEAKTDEDVLIALTDNTHALKHYFQKLVGDKVRATWVKYDRREERDDWDYLISFHRFKNEGLIKSGAWPLAEVIYEEKVDGVTISAISKRTDNFVKLANDAVKANDVQAATENYIKATQANPKNEQAWIGLINLYFRTQNFPEMKKAIDEALKLTNSHVTILTNLGLYYLQTNDMPNAIKTLEQVVALNYKSTPAYYYLALAYNNSGDALRALNTLEKFAINDGNIVQAYDLAAQLSANELHKQDYFKAKKAFFQQQYQEAYQLVSQAVQRNPKYQPAVDFKAAIEKASQKSNQ